MYICIKIKIRSEDIVIARLMVIFPIYKVSRWDTMSSVSKAQTLLKAVYEHLWNWYSFLQDYNVPVT